MLKDIITAIVELIIIIPIFLIFFKKQKSNYIALILFICFFLLNQELLRLPSYFRSFDIIEGKWNWDGKLFAIIGSTIFYMLFKKHIKLNDFITFRQLKNSLKPIVILATIILFLEILLRYFLGGKPSLDYETLAFQLTMPGIDEEFAFRGIMLGLSTSILPQEFMLARFNIGNPSAYISAILFGLIHSFHFDNDWNVIMDWLYFVVTFLIGFAHAWMTLKSKSIITPIISHNLTNFIGNLTAMLK